MRIVCVGGGPAGLYFAISAKRRDAGHDVTVIERDPPGATYGWGVVYWDNLLDILFRNDPESARAVRDASILWQEQEVSLGGPGLASPGSAYLAGYGFSVQRAVLLDILARRAEDLGVRVERRTEVTDLSPYADADLVVVADGANSRVRALDPDVFGTRTTVGANPYIWLGTDKRFDKFTFAFERTPAGWVWFHAYPSGAAVSTCIVECSPRTWAGLGLDTASDEDGRRTLERIFKGPLDGHSLISQSRGQPAPWLRFTEVVNRTWQHGNVVLVGDAAHTTHFTLGSGTALAIMDAVMLAQCLHEHGDDVPAALRDFDQQGREALLPLQAEARTSMAWFEHLDRYLDQDPVAFAYSMAVRQGQQPPWLYQMHRATQVPVLRRTRRELSSGTRWLLARRRGEPREHAAAR
jgi:2-polyprenyl-6-methoxyphenol hydroxylase-like FAD-dependent oxidoreductase